MKADVRIRRMSEGDLDQVMAIAGSLKEAPYWTRTDYIAALRPDAMPLRIALVAEDTFPQGLKPEAHFEQPLAQLKLRPFKATEPFKATVPFKTPEPFKSADLRAAGRIVGFAVAGVLLPEAELESIVVSAAEQRRGVGRKLFFAMVEELGRVGVREVLLEVRASNQGALDFYRSLGWSETGRRPRYYADPEEDAVLMSLKLE
jgi:ribosomal-protein-alanine N-acetyltransferase